MDNLTPIQTKALCLLAAGYGVEDVANKTGVSVRTLSRWKNSEGFRNRLNYAINECFNASVAELVEGCREAVIQLKGVISDPDISARSRIAAINVLLTNAIKVIPHLPIVSEESEEAETELTMISNDAEALAREYRRIINGS